MGFPCNVAQFPTLGHFSSGRLERFALPGRVSLDPISPSLVSYVPMYSLGGLAPRSGRGRWTLLLERATDAITVCIRFLPSAQPLQRHLKSLFWRAFLSLNHARVTMPPRQS